jgi:hypothetical protein
LPLQELREQTGKAHNPIPSIGPTASPLTKMREII